MKSLNCDIRRCHYELMNDIGKYRLCRIFTDCTGCIDNEIYFVIELYHSIKFAGKDGLIRKTNNWKYCSNEGGTLK